MKHGFFLLAMLLAIVNTPVASASGVSPYLPLHASPLIERYVEHLLAITDGAPLSKPYKAADISQKLQQIKQSQPKLYQQLSRYMARYTRRSGMTLSNISLSSHHKADNQYHINQYGLSYSDQLTIESQGFHFFSPYVLAAVGVRASYNQDSGSKTSQINSHISVGNQYLQLDLGYRPHWYSSMQLSNLMLSTHAQESPSISLSNLYGLTPWNIRYDVFYRKLDDDSVVNSKNLEGLIDLTSALPNGDGELSGLHISVTPLDNLTLGYSQVTHTGGAGQSLDLIEQLTAIINPDALKSINSAQIVDYQQSSTSIKWNTQLGIPLSVYGEYHRNEQPNQSEIGHGFAVGAHVPQVSPYDLSLTVEFTDWKGPWYQGKSYALQDQQPPLSLGHFAWLAESEGSQHLAVSAGKVFSQRHYVDARVDITHHQLIPSALSEGIRNTTPIAVELGYRYIAKHGVWHIRLHAGEDLNQQGYGKISLGYEW